MCIVHDDRSSPRITVSGAECVKTVITTALELEDGDKLNGREDFLVHTKKFWHRLPKVVGLCERLPDTDEVKRD